MDAGVSCAKDGRSNPANRRASPASFSLDIGPSTQEYKSATGWLIRNVFGSHSNECMCLMFTVYLYSLTVYMPYWFYG
jgi:hypothetical protein